MLIKNKLQKKLSKKFNVNNNLININIISKIKNIIYLSKERKKYIYFFSGISSFIRNSNIFYTNKIYKKSFYFLNFYKRKYYLKKNKKRNNYCLYYTKSLFFFWKKEKINQNINLKLRKKFKKLQNKKYKYFNKNYKININKFKIIQLFNFNKLNKENKILCSNNFTLFSFFNYSFIKTFYILNKDYNFYNRINNNNKLMNYYYKIQKNNNNFFQFYNNDILLINKKNNYLLSNIKNLTKKINKILFIIKKNYRLYYNIYLKKIKKKKFILFFNKNLLKLRNFNNNNLKLKNNYFYFIYLNNKLFINTKIIKNNYFTLTDLNIFNYILKKNNIISLNNKFLLKNNYLYQNTKYLWNWYLILFLFIKKIKNNLNNNNKFFLIDISKKIFNLNNNINFKFNINNIELYNKNMFIYNNKFKILFKFIIKQYYKLYFDIYDNKILHYRFLKRKYNKNYKYKINNIIKIFKKTNYFNTRRYNIKKFNKIWLKISKFINNNKNKKIKNINYFGIVTINICLNNTYITLTDLEGKVISTLCGGLLKIKGPKRSTNVASETIAYKMTHLIKNKGIQFIILKLNGILHTRKMKSALKAIRSGNYAIIKCINITPKAHNGIRRKKRKRL